MHFVGSKRLSNVVGLAVLAGGILVGASAYGQEPGQTVGVTKRESDNKWHLSGFASASFLATDGGLNTFERAQFAPVFHFQHKNLIFFEGELEIEVEEDGGTAFELSYATINIILSDYAAVGFGKLISPIGQFQQNTHPPWINKLPTAPAGFGHGGVQPLSDLGVTVRGGFQIKGFEGQGATANPLINYAFFVGNGPQVKLEDGELEELEQEGFGSDDNSNKAIGGRIAIVPIPHFEIGASFMTAKVIGKKDDVTPGMVTEGTYTVWGADVVFSKGPFNARFEYLEGKLGSFWSQREAGDPTEFIPATVWQAWYGQLAYKLSGITDREFFKNFELVARYGKFDVKGFAHFVEHAGPEKRSSVGLNYWFTPSAVLKMSTEWRDFVLMDAVDVTEYRAQMAYGF